MFTNTKHTSSPRRTHRRRFSAVHLSSDTTATLPDYHQASEGINSWKRHSSQDTSIGDDNLSDKPPDYPDSAEEADEDTDSENPRNPFFLHHLPTGPPQASASTSSPRRKQRLYQHKRKHSAILSQTSPVDPYLDALLERSVHALEMSNTLLQSSITTQTSLSNVFACDSPADTSLEAKAVNLSAKIRGQWDGQAPWMDDFEEITKKVDSLFGESMDLTEDMPQETTGLKIRYSRPPNTDPGLSCSLPSTTSTLRDSRRQRRRPSLDLRAACSTDPSGATRLRLAHQSREDLIAPPPRALTQYIESGADPAFVTLPSTLGVRSGNSVFPNADWNGSTTSLHSTPALPVITHKPLPSSSTPAYTKLASFVIKRPSNSASHTPSSSFTSSFMIKRRNSSVGASERNRRKSSPPRWSSELARSHSTPNPVSPLSQQHRPMTPTAEESSSSSDGCIAKQTISSLRKILDEQPPPEDTKSVSSSIAKKSHIFMPVTPPPAAVSGTSTATASISRMLTKKVHHSSTRPPSPPRQSAMKGSRPTTPSSTIAFPSSPANFGEMLAVPPRLTIFSGLPSSASSSGRSTPKRISFAELPEAHISSRPEKFKSKGNKRKGKGKSVKAQGNGGYEEGFGEEDGISMGEWLAAWFGLNPSAALGTTGLTYAARQEERTEDRIARGWGARTGGYGYSDEWAV